MRRRDSPASTAPGTARQQGTERHTEEQRRARAAAPYRHLTRRLALDFVDEDGQGAGRRPETAWAEVPSETITDA
jgi:hypothetical protein